MIVPRPFGNWYSMSGPDINSPSSADIDEAIAQAMATLRNRAEPLSWGALAIIDRIEDGIAHRQRDRIIEGFNKCLEAGDRSPMARVQAMSRVPPTPVDIWVDGKWTRGTVRACTVTEDGETCSAVVSYGRGLAYMTVRVDAARMRKPSGDHGCPATHQDATCG